MPKVEGMGDFTVREEIVCLKENQNAPRPLSSANRTETDPQT